MRTRTATPLLAAALAACGTIDQVPLAYVSTVKVGVSAESATAQVPGGKVMIGVEATDAALVPIAVGRTCRSQGRQTCGRIDQVRGNNDISPATYLQLAQARAQAVRGASADIRRDEQALAAAVATTAARTADDVAARAKDQLVVDLKDEAQGEAARIAAIDVMSDPVATQRAADRDARLAAARAARKALGDTAAALDTARRAEAEARKSLTDSYARFDATQQALQQALDQHPGASGKREDALSVFGSFNTAASVDAGASGAGLKLGKSFSTGVAAQLLTEGFRQAAASDAMTACITAANAIDQRNQAAVTAAVEACKASQRPSL